MCHCRFLSNDVQNIAYPDESALLPPRSRHPLSFSRYHGGQKKMYLEGHPATHFAFNKNLNHFNIVLSFMIFKKSFNYLKRLIHASFSFVFRSLEASEASVQTH